jgi:hypothetical protein
MGSYFGLDTVTIKDIQLTDCKDYTAIIYLEIPDPADLTKKLTVSCNLPIDRNPLVFEITKCTGAPIRMDDLGNTIGLEFTKSI